MNNSPPSKNAPTLEALKARVKTAHAAYKVVVSEKLAEFKAKATPAEQLDPNTPAGQAWRLEQEIEQLSAQIIALIKK